MRVYLLFNGDQVLRINAESEDHIQILKELERDVDSGVSVKSLLSAVKDFLKKNNVPFTVMINNVQELLVREREEMVHNVEMERKTKSFSFAAYHDLETIYNFMDTLVASHSNLISKVKIGSTYENCPMYVLKRKKTWIDAGIPAREWISHATAVWLADRIATDFKENRAPVPSILSQMDIYLMIVANPDGYVSTQRSLSVSSHSLVSVNRSATSNPKCHGVDLNRNWDAEFGGPGASDDPCAEDHCGPSAQSENKVKNMAGFIMSHGNFKSFMTLHSYMHGTDAPDQPELHDVATQASKALNSWHGTVYKVGSIFHILQASGASVDWTYLLGIKYSFAFELRDTGEYGFLLPADQIVSTARETWFALRYILKYVCDHPY
uniref:Carboxypeptidase A2 (pancreatic) n=1 Tax=Sinocyclocheilus anshuiensis TaxID=1608454 RepID=A0A671KFZ3_9TELE